MNGAGDRGEVATTRLPSGNTVKVQLVGGGDQMGSVGLRDTVDLDGAVEAVAEVGYLLLEKLQSLKPTKTVVELTFGFTAEAGKLTALIVNGKAEAALTLTMEWVHEH